MKSQTYLSKTKSQKTLVISKISYLPQNCQNARKNRGISSMVYSKTMDTKTRQVYDKLVTLFAGAGLSQSSAKVFTWLVICEPALQTAEDIHHATGVSAGGISETMSMLTKTGLAVRQRKEGDRKYYYEITKESFMQSIKQRAVVAGISRDIANESLTVLPDNQRLIAMRDMYGFVADSLLEMMDEFDKKAL